MTCAEKHIIARYYPNEIMTMPFVVSRILGEVTTPIGIPAVREAIRFHCKELGIECKLAYVHTEDYEDSRMTYWHHAKGVRTPYKFIEIYGVIGDTDKAMLKLNGEFPFNTDQIKDMLVKYLLTIYEEAESA